ncbi:MAG: divalent-cation tolerance protein CutA [Curvibacter sp.]|nr:divalent-cation tolerance protein CutA [Curvibacter sp.]
MPSDAPLWVACTTVALEDDARRLAREAVSLGLAACAQWEAIRSCYRWDGQVQDEGEWRLTFKTLGHALPSLHDWVHAQHPYALPQWVAWPAQASGPYLGWVAAGLA